MKADFAEVWVRLKGKPLQGQLFTPAIRGPVGDRPHTQETAQAAPERDGSADPELPQPDATEIHCSQWSKR
ncbi:hypothetical protein ACFXKJ_41820, partial [Kitasatospora indigofera]|uniref:hypothetical protein n=1 Tax=Kitasatospora indigofera TaxID=67307 RepID=UPI00367BD56D